MRAALGLKVELNYLPTKGGLTFGAHKFGPKIGTLSSVQIWNPKLGPDQNLDPKLGPQFESHFRGNQHLGGSMLSSFCDPSRVSCY